MPWNLGNTPTSLKNLRVLYFHFHEISQMPSLHGNILNIREFGEFLKYLRIWGIFQIPGILGIPQVPIFIKSIIVVGSWGTKYKEFLMLNILIC